MDRLVDKIAIAHENSFREALARSINKDLADAKLNRMDIDDNSIDYIKLYAHIARISGVSIRGTVFLKPGAVAPNRNSILIATIKLNNPSAIKLARDRVYGIAADKVRKEKLPYSGKVVAEFIKDQLIDEFYRISDKISMLEFKLITTEQVQQLLENI